MSAFDAVLFDLDGTLCEYDQDPETVIASTFDGAAVDPFCSGPEFRAAARTVGDVEDDHAFLTRAFEIAAERHGGPADRAAAMARAYDEVIDHSSVSFRPGAEAALAAASDRPTALVTNGSRRTQTPKLSTLGLSGAFDAVVYAGDDTPPKPDPEPFRTALAALDAPARRSLYVGNSLHADVVGASDAGLAAAWYPTADAAEPESVEATPDHVLETLSDLPALL